MATEVITQPTFARIEPYIPIRVADEAFYATEVEWWSRELESNIQRNPRHYGRVLGTLGDVATCASLERLLGTDLSPDDTEAAFLIHTYFAGRCDQGTEYDDATEEALLTDAEYQRAYGSHRKATSKQVLATKATHKIIPDKNAEPSRDALRRTRLAFYIQRTVDWQDQELLRAG